MPQRLNASIHYTDENDIEYEITGRLSPLDPGKFDGPPEDCYPPEGGDLLWFNVESDDTTRSDMFSDRISTDAKLFADIEQRMLESLDD